LIPHRTGSAAICDEFAESHGKELVVREAVGASIPLAGVGCAIERGALARLAAAEGGRPFIAASMTEDYEMGLRVGALGLKTMFVRIPAVPGNRSVVSSRGHFPAGLDAAIRQKARWVGGIAFAGWDRLGWRGGPGERWMRMRDRRGPLAAMLMVAGYGAAFLWLQLGIARPGAPALFALVAAAAALLTINATASPGALVRAGFVTATYGPKRACCPSHASSSVRIAILAVKKALGSTPAADRAAGTRPATSSCRGECRMSASIRFPGSALPRGRRPRCQPRADPGHGSLRACGGRHDPPHAGHRDALHAAAPANAGGHDGRAGLSGIRPLLALCGLSAASCCALLLSPAGQHTETGGCARTICGLERGHAFARTSLLWAGGP
jgi:hypothetical protein